MRDENAWKAKVRIVFEAGPGGAEALHGTLIRAVYAIARHNPDVKTIVPDVEVLGSLITLIEVSGAYAPEGSRYRALYEETRPKESHAD